MDCQVRPQAGIVARTSHLVIMLQLTPRVQNLFVFQFVMSYAFMCEYNSPTWPLDNVASEKNWHHSLIEENGHKVSLELWH